MPHPALSSSLMVAPRIILFTLVLIAVASGLTLAWLRGVRALYPEAWARRPIRRIIWGALGLLGLSLLAQPLARSPDAPHQLRLVIVSVGGVGLTLLALTTPFVWFGVWLRRRAERRMPAPVPSSSSSPSSPSTSSSFAEGLTRRELALTTARLAPVGGAMVATLGTRQGHEMARVVEVEMAFPELPRELEGLRILQFSDVHLGAFIDIDEIEALVAEGERARADLVVLTGDIADDLPQLPRALALFEGLRPRLGVYASIGNHEYFRGIRAARRAYDGSQVPLLLDSGTTIDVDGAKLHLSGADDPRFLGRQTPDFFKRTVATSLDGAPSDAFHVLMSHRPEGFVAARQAGVQLTLSGHTHGAQLGNGERSLLEPLLPDKYLWGAYQEGPSRLYTSSGAGHWFPFRIGCPRELPVIKLVRGPLETRAIKRKIG